GRSWSRIEATVDVGKGEALSFVLDRRGDDFQVVRLSRAAELAGGAFDFRGGVVAERRPVAFTEQHAGNARLVLERESRAIRASLSRARALPARSRHRAARLAHRDRDRRLGLLRDVGLLRTHRPGAADQPARDGGGAGGALAGPLPDPRRADRALPARPERVP